MSIEDLVRLLVGAIPLLTAAVTAIAGVTRGRDRARRQLHDDAQVYALLPEGEARDVVADLLRDDVEAIKARRALTIDAPQLALALVGSSGMGFLTVWLVQRGTWWGFAAAALTAVVALACFVGIFDAATPKDRPLIKQEREKQKREKAAAKAAARSSSN